MAFRLCLAFCLLAAAAASMVRNTMEARLREKLRSDSWVDRANAAVLLADNPRAVAWLLAAAEDEAPPVRANARWALHRLTGLPWADRASECAAWWTRAHSPEQASGAAPPSDSENMLDFGVPEFFDLQVRLESDAIVVSIENHSDRALNFAPIPSRDYSSVLYSRQGSPVRILDAPEPAAGVVETRVWDHSGRLLQTWYWNLGGFTLEREKASSENYDLSAFPPGRFLVESLAGPFAASSDSADWTLGVMTARNLRRVVILDR